MNVGMLWYDDDKKSTLEEKVSQAVNYYENKYGRAPTLCLVNPRTLNGGPKKVAKLELRSAHNVLLHHFWVGIAENGNGASGSDIYK
jgi:hypothetical protein